MVHDDFCVVDNIVYMGTVNSSSVANPHGGVIWHKIWKSHHKTGHMVICVMYNRCLKALDTPKLTLVRFPTAQL